MKARLEALPNVGTVDVQRSAPGPRREYSWTVSFVSNPGYFPYYARDVALLVPNDEQMWPKTASGPRAYNWSVVEVVERIAGSNPMGGTRPCAAIITFRWRHGPVATTPRARRVDAAGPSRRRRGAVATTPRGCRVDAAARSRRRRGGGHETSTRRRRRR